jgi:tetratricopeptide (TPR) repeat protein
MPEDVKLLKIVVASPSDVQTERDLVPRVVEEVNRGVAGERGLVLKVTRWETDAFPGFHAGGPQALIDAILRIPECDIFVGIFWNRFGTPVADAKSGTDHEYKLAYETWKQKGCPQIFFYFNEKPYSPKLKEETDQKGLVLDFKKNFPKEGLWWPYTGKNQFRKILRDHLEAYLRKEFPVGPGHPDPPGTATALHQIPAPPGDFTGRTVELDELMAKVEKGGLTISGLQGMGGIGKTALALKLAEQLRPRYLDAQIYLDLKGTSEKHLTAAEAMAHVIRSYRLDYKPPENQAELAAQYLSVLDGQRAILLMDNAREAAQVAPLVPPASCVMLCFAKDLSALRPEDAQKLLLVIAPRINGQADEIARVCGFLPLALRLAASALAERPDLSPAVYLYRLTNAEERVKLVEASLSLSYELLKAESQKRFRLLAVFPETFDARAAAAVWAMEPALAQDALGELVRYSLVNWIEARQRYQLHDLVRAFSEGRLTPEERDEGQRRHAAHFVEVAASADDLYLKGGDASLTGLRLFDAEWANIREGQHWAAAHAEKDKEAARLCNNYPGVAAYCLGLRLHPRESIEWLQAALGAAQQLKDRQAEGVHLGNLGIAYGQLGETRRAIECYEEILALHREMGDRQGEGKDLGNLGTSYRQLGEPRRAIEYYKQQLDITREIPDRRGEGNALGGLGNAYMYLGEPRRAIEYYEQILTLHREMGDREAEGKDLGNLGNAYAALGEPRRAIDYYEKQLVITREIGDRRGEGNALWNMSLALDQLGQRDDAIANAEAALKILGQIEAPHVEQVRRQLAQWRGQD